MAAAPAAISVRQVSKKYRLFDRPIDRVKEALSPFRRRYHRDFWALRDVSFDVLRGQTCGIIGRNGSGKSTLLQIIASVMPPSSGSVAAEGRIASLLELGGGFNPEMTGRDNVGFYTRMMGLADAEAQRRLPDIERFADIGDFFDQPVKTYSSGMFVRLAFAAAINVDPDILIIDEALSVGDAKFQQKCFQKISEFRDRNCTILLVSHASDLLLRLCENAVLLDGGRLIEHGEPKRVIDRYHALLFASDRISKGRGADAPLAAEAESRDAQVIAGFMSDSTPGDNCPSRRSYSRNETVLGDARAEIVDYLIVAGGRVDPPMVESGETLDFYIKVWFHDGVLSPHIGFAMTLADGVLILGTNTLLGRYRTASAAAGDLRIYKFSLTLDVTGGDYFCNFGIFESYESEQNYLHVRRGMAQLTVAQTPWCTGFIEIRPEFAEIAVGQPVAAVGG